MKKKTNVTRERRKIIMTENNYSIFDDVTMPEYLKDKNLPEHYYYLLKYVGKTGQTLELIEEAINAEEEGKRPILKVASKKLLTAELCLVAVQKNSRNMEFVPQKLRNSEMYDVAVQKNGDLIRFVPEELQTEEMCLLALKTSVEGMAVTYIPQSVRKKRKAPKWYELAVQYNGLALNYVPNKYMTQEMIKAAIQASKEGRGSEGESVWPITYVPKKFRTEEILLLSLQQNCKSIKGFAPKDITPGLIAHYLESENAKGDIIRYIPSYALKERVLNSIRKEIKDHGYGEKLVFGQQNDEKRLETIKVLPSHNSPLVYSGNERKLRIRSKTKELIAETVTNKLAPEIKKKVETNVYYISDIHIEHNLDVVGKTYSEIKTIIDDFVKRFVCEHTPEDILLVGGDVSCFISLNKMFYQSLQYYWKGAIICVLGNHDVWNYEDKKQNREEHLSIEAVAKQIEQSFEESLFSNTRILLENALYLKLQDSAWGASWNTKGTRLSEEQIIEASVDELKAYFKKASVVVLGGLGFSGKNETFNASNGIYNYALTRPEDIERSSRFEKIYNKMKQCAADVPVIVLTHTPMHDWSGQQYHPGWIYVSGHTHQNFRSLDWNGAIRLEDNQLGYQAKDVKLKKFVLNHETYDPLVELPDGIHTISKVEYLDYNQAHKIVIPRFGHNGEIIALKKNLWYMFLLRKNGYLYILDGAKTRVVHKDIRFYYDNLEGYCKCIMKIFGPFCQYEQQIAELVKQTGGEGKIHGCIIDFDFYNHVFVNPLDGSLVPYIALSKTYKSVYTNFMELRNNPQFGSSALGLSEKGGEPLTAIELTAVNKLEQYKCKSEPAGDSIVYDTTIYKYSGIVKSIQYIIDKHIVRVWRDEFLKYTGADSLKGSLNSIPAAEIESYFEESEKEEK